MSRGLGDVYKRQILYKRNYSFLGVKRANRHKQTMLSSTIGCLLSFVSGLFQIAGKGREGNDKISQK